MLSRSCTGIQSFAHFFDLAVNYECPDNCNRKNDRKRHIRQRIAAGGIGSNPAVVKLRDRCATAGLHAAPMNIMNTIITNVSPRPMPILLVTVFFFFASPASYQIREGEHYQTRRDQCFSGSYRTRFSHSGGGFSLYYTAYAKSAAHESGAGTRYAAHCAQKRDTPDKSHSGWARICRSG